jgi:hypothetical protein
MESHFAKGYPLYGISTCAYRAIGAGQASQAMARPPLVDRLGKVVGAICAPCMPQ